MNPPRNPGRRGVVRTLAGLSLACAAPVWAQPKKSTRTVTAAQIVDTSTSQIDVSKDFLVGSRAAWQEINSGGGLQGSAVKHLVLEVDGSAASLRSAVAWPTTANGQRARSQIAANKSRSSGRMPST